MKTQEYNDFDVSMSLVFFSTLEKHSIGTRCDLSKAEVHLGKGHMGSKIQGLAKFLFYETKLWKLTNLGL